METNHKKILKAIVLELRHMLEGYYNGSGWHAGDLEQRLNALGVWRDRDPLPADELAGLGDADRNARKVIDAYLKLRNEAGVSREEAAAEFVRETAYTWANRLLALRCMEARDLIDEVILQKDVYGGRSLEHSRLVQRNPELCLGNDDGLFAVFDRTFAEQAIHLPLLFDPRAPGVALRPSAAALKRAIALLSGSQNGRAQEPATGDVFRAPDAFGWAYQYWNTEEKGRVFERVRTEKGTKIEGADIIPATQLYTEPYMVKFLVENSLGAMWASMNPSTKLTAAWGYYIKNADRALVEKRRVQELTFLDPACGSGHFLLEAFDFFYAMYEEEDEITNPESICRSILENNLYGIDIDERAVQISEAALWMKAAEKVLLTTGSPSLNAVATNLVTTNIRLPRGRNHLQTFLEKHPEDQDLSSALEVVLNGLQHADQLGSLMQIEGPVEAKLKELQLRQQELALAGGVQAHMFEPTLVQHHLPFGVKSLEEWKMGALARLKDHFIEESTVGEAGQSFFSRFAERGLRTVDVLARRYDVVAANPPYMGSGNMGQVVKAYVERHYKDGRRDLYGAFIARAEQLCAANGYIAMITLDSWLTKDGYIGLRNTLLTHDSIQGVIRLGRYAFSDADPPGFPALLVIQKVKPESNHRVNVLAIRQPMKSEHQAALIRKQVTVLSEAYRLVQRQLRDLPRSMILTGVTSYMLDLLTARTPLSQQAALCEPSTTGDNERFVRFQWEVRETGHRWHLMAKGGGHKRWKGLERYVIDWEHNGTRIKNFPGSYVRNAQQMFQYGLTFTAMSRHGISFRAMADGMTFGKAGPGIFPPSNLDELMLAALNSRAYEYLLRSLNPGASVSLGSVGRLPSVPSKHSEAIEKLAARAVRVTADMNKDDLLERDFVPPRPVFQKSLLSHISSQMVREVKRQCVLLLSRDRISRYIEDGLELDYASSDVLRQQQPLASDLPLRTPLQQATSETLLSEEKGTEITATSDAGLRGDEVFERAKLLLAQESPSPEDDELSEEDESDDDESAADQGSFHEGKLDFIARTLEIHPVTISAVAVSAIRDGSLMASPSARLLAKGLLTVTTLTLLGHLWPCEVHAGSELPQYAESSGIILITGSSISDSLGRRVSEAVNMNYGPNASAELEQVLGTELDRFLEREFFSFHTRQFRRRPLAWHIQSSKFSGRRAPAFACFVYYRSLTGQTLTAIQSQFLRPILRRCDTELRGIESLPQSARSERQQERLTTLLDLIPELRAFDQQLEELSRSGFGPGALLPQLRQYAIDDAVRNLKAQWLQKLSATIKKGPLTLWCSKADTTKLHRSLATWIADSMLLLRHHCSAVGAAAPKAESLNDEPNSETLAFLICKDPDEMAQLAIKLGCLEWWRPLDETVFAPLRAQIKLAKDELKVLKAEDYSKANDPFKRKNEIETRTKELKESAKRRERDLNEKTAAANKLRDEIMAWECSEARGWETWLAALPMYDAISSLDGVHQAPRTVAEWVAQESAYVPDINDGVRVNVAPLQKAGILAAEVLPPKDVNKAIADRAQWRADERRWCREGKLPQPGWWPMEKTNGSGQE